MDLMKFTRGSKPTCWSQCSLVLEYNIIISAHSSLEPGWASLQKKADQCDTLNCPKQGGPLNGLSAVDSIANTTSFIKSKKCLANPFFVHMKSCSEGANYTMKFLFQSSVTPPPCPWWTPWARLPCGARCSLVLAPNGKILSVPSLVPQWTPYLNKWAWSEKFHFEKPTLLLISHWYHSNLSG